VRFAKSILTGGAASLADFATLTALVELFRLTPTQANIPSLLVGATIQFVGNRHLVFSAGHLAMGPQLFGFVLVEMGTFLLNAGSFYVVVRLSPIPYPIVRLVCSFLVFSLFSYPLWKRVFADKQHGTKKDAP
jgi:putative flippase GtrA